MAKFDLVKYSNKVKAARQNQVKKETTGTRIVRILVVMIATYMFWSTLVVLNLNTLLHNVLMALLFALFISYSIFVIKKK